MKSLRYMNSFACAPGVCTDKGFQPFHTSSAPTETFPGACSSLGATNKLDKFLVEL